MDELDLLDAEPAYLGAARREFPVDSKKRGEGTYVLHGKGDATGLAPGGVVWTPDNIMWDVVAIDADKQGFTATKIRDDVSFAAWLTGDWSKVYSDAPVFEDTPMQKAASHVEAVKTELEESIKAGLKAGAEATRGAGTSLAIGAGAVAAAALVVAAVAKRYFP